MSLSMKVKRVEVIQENTYQETTRNVATEGRQNRLHSQSKLALNNLFNQFPPLKFTFLFSKNSL